MKMRNVTRFIGGAAAVALSACAGQPQPNLAGKLYPQEQGVVIAESVMVPGVTVASSMDGGMTDCAGPGLGVKVEGAVSTKREVFDSNAEPCESASVLFDGASAKGRRPADPAITILFNDNLGALPANPLHDPLKPMQPDPLAAIPPLTLKTEDIESIEPAAGAQISAAPVQLAAKSTPVETRRVEPDSLTSTLQNWQTENATQRGLLSTDAAEATRQLDNAVRQQQAETEQNEVSKLLAELREKERRLEAEQVRRKALIDSSENKRQKTEAALASWQANEQKLRAELQATQTRMAELESQSARMAQEKARKEAAYEDRLKTLGSDLKVAEAQASQTRQELILQAAAKIAEAEKLAAAAKLQEQQIQLREAARLKQEADQMMQRALDIDASKPIMAANIEPAAAPLALGEVPVVLHAKDVPLTEMIEKLLGQAKAQAGEWKADWQLSGQAQYILKEKWSLTAEAPVKELLQQLAGQVEAAHGIKLNFNQFQQSRLLVITDAK